MSKSLTSTRSKGRWVWAPLLLISIVILVQFTPNLHIYLDTNTTNNGSNNNIITTSTTRTMTQLHTTKKYILYIIRTFPERYEERLSIQANSWMRQLDPETEAVLVASADIASSTINWTDELARNVTQLSLLDVPSFFSTPQCMHNNHGMGLCCQEARALLLASHEAYLREFEWIFVIDEDVFVYPKGIRQIVDSMSSSSILKREVPLSIGTLGCAHGKYVGFCGGGGYLIHRSALAATTAVDGFYDKYMNVCEEAPYCDIVTAHVMEQYANVTLMSDSRLHPWGIGRPFPQHLCEGEVDEYDDQEALLAEILTKRHATMTMKDTVKVKQPLPSDAMLREVLMGVSDASSDFQYLQSVICGIRSGDYATLHYFGGELTENYTTYSEKNTFLQLLFDVALMRE